VDRREKLKKKILELIDESREDWRKAAFYSDKTVQDILDRLYTRWEESNRRNRPIDYATIEELEILAKLAEKYQHVGQDYMARMYLGGIEGEEGIIEEEESFLKKSLKRLFLGGR